jgi:hypothetical protein
MEDQGDKNSFPGIAAPEIYYQGAVESKCSGFSTEVIISFIHSRT